MISNIYVQKNVPGEQMKGWKAKFTVNTGSGRRSKGLAAANIETPVRHDCALAVANYVVTVLILLRHREMMFYSEIPFVLHSKNFEALRQENNRISPPTSCSSCNAITRFPESHLGNKHIAKN